MSSLVAQRTRPPVVALRREEREAHRAADQHHVGDLQEAVDHRDLVGHLRAAHDRDERARGVLENAGERPDLAFEQPPGGGGEQVGDALGARVRAVGDAEGVVDVHLGERRERTGELGIVALLAGLEADVLQHQHARPSRELAIRSSARTSRDHDAGGERRLARPDQLAQARRRRAPSRAPPRRRPSGAVEVGDEHQARALGAQLFDRGQRGADAGVVGDLHLAAPGSGRERDVEVDAHQHTPSAHVEIIEAPQAIPPDRPP